jgi:hypothetical protein
MRDLPGILGILLLAFLPLACRSTSEEEPALPVGIVVAPREEGRLFGAEATYLVHVPIEHMEKVLLDFGSQADFRTIVLESKPLTVGPKGGSVYFRFRGALGIDPRATCTYAISEEEGAWHLAFEMGDSSLTLWTLKGSFELRSVDGGSETLVVQRFFVSAIRIDRDELLDDLRRDAGEIRDHAESTYQR